MPVRSNNNAVHNRASLDTVPTVSNVFRDGSILEMTFDRDDQQTRFSFCQQKSLRRLDKLPVNSTRCLVPYAASNNLIHNEIVLFPTEAEVYDTVGELVSEIRAFIHRYVDVSPLFEEMCCYYVLLTWVYDAFNELPYLRVRGDPGTGKTRFLLIVGSLCYKPIFASGASSVSPLFRLLETFKGTLVIDESDFRFSDEKAEMVKILNNGNVRGFPVLRSEGNSRGEYNPRAYQVFGPKIVATRGDFDDKALESRFLTEEMSRRRLRTDVPINLPSAYKEEARRLRNKLLMFRFRNRNNRLDLSGLVDPILEPRLNQIFVPLLSIIEDRETRERLRTVARQYQRDMMADRGLSTEAQVLEIIQLLCTHSEDFRVTIRDITERFSELHGDDYLRKITSKWIGTIIRKRLHLQTVKTHGNFVIPPSEMPKLQKLFEEYGLIPVPNESPHVHPEVVSA